MPDKPLVIFGKNQQPWFVSFRGDRNRGWYEYIVVLNLKQCIRLMLVPTVVPIVP